VQKAREIAAQGTVLLKNESSLLPLSPSGTPTVAVIGEAAKAAPITGGGGSSHVPAGSVVSIVDGVAQRLGSAGRVDYIHGWNATVFRDSGVDPPGRMLDGDPNTRWTTGTPMADGQWITVDMGGVRSIDQIRMDSGPSPGDYARGYRVYLSTDGSTWGNPVASGTGTGQLITASFPTPVGALHQGRADRERPELVVDPRIHRLSR
jgi:hypothetical protein